MVDILPGEKLKMAKADEIAAEVSLPLPNLCGIGDFDLCVIKLVPIYAKIHRKKSRMTRI